MPSHPRQAILDPSAHLPRAGRWCALVAVGVLMVGCGSDSPATTGASRAADPRPNILIIVADDLGWADLGCYGNTYFRTPNLDALAANGVRFDHAYAACHVCSPTRASLLTGRTPARVGLTNYLYGTKEVADSPVRPAGFADRLPLEEVTIAETLRGEGYATGLIGKWHLGENTSLGESDPRFHGFSVTESWDYGLLPRGDSYEWFHTGDTTGAKQLPAITDEITAGAVDYITRHRDSTFFLMVTHYAVHLPLQADPAVVAEYEARDNPKPGEFNPIYGAMLEAMDVSVGEIINSLRQNGLLDNTLIVFVSDNGGLVVSEAGPQPTSNAPLRNGKGTMYEGGLRVPMIAYYKGHCEGGVVNESVITTTDFFPSLLGLIDKTNTAETNFDGTDLSAVLLDPTQRAPDRDLYWHYPHFSNQGGRPRSALRREPYKLIENLDRRGRTLRPPPGSI